MGFMTCTWGQPPDLDATDKILVSNLNKAFMASKQASRTWFERLMSTLLGYCFCPTVSRHCVFLNGKIENLCIHICQYDSHWKLILYNQ